MTKIIVDLPEDKEKDLNRFVELWQIKNYFKSKADAVVDIINNVFVHKEKKEVKLQKLTGKNKSPIEDKTTKIEF